MSCDEDPTADQPKVVKIFNRSLLFDAVSRAEPEALDGLLEYLQSRDKRLTDEDFRGEASAGRKEDFIFLLVYTCRPVRIHKSLWAGKVNKRVGVFV